MSRLRRKVPKAKTKDQGRVKKKVSVSILVVCLLMLFFLEVTTLDFRVKLILMSMINKARIFEAGFGEKVVFSWPSVDRFGQKCLLLWSTEG